MNTKMCCFFFKNKLNGKVLINFPHTLDEGLAQFSNRYRSYPIDISLDIDISLYGDVNLVPNKTLIFGGKGAEV